MTSTLFIKYSIRLQLDIIFDQINLDTTLFVIVSKSFSTQETLTNARHIQRLYIDSYGKQAIKQHFATVSTQVEAAYEFGIPPENIFPMWDSALAERFSLWSPQYFHSFVLVYDIRQGV